MDSGSNPPRYLDDPQPSSSSAANQHLHDGTPPQFSTSALLASLNLKSHNLHKSNSKSKFDSRARRNKRNPDDVNSDLDSDSSSSSSSRDSFSTWTSSREDREAQLEWDEGIRQLQLAVQLLLFPFVGKWLGRKWSYWAFAQYQLTRSFSFLLPINFSTFNWFSSGSNVGGDSTTISSPELDLTDL